ncbi:MAG: polysaccharide deacetylase family protein [Granulosicoccus sp.]
MSTRERARAVMLDLMSLFNKHETADNGTVVFLAYHFMFDDNLDNFRELLDWLAEEYNFLTVTDAVNQIKAGTLTGKNLCFTCDDGFQSCLMAGSILKEYGASCCFFLCPDFIELKDRDQLKFYNQNRLGGPPIEFLNWNDVESLQKNGHEIGNHTLNHENLGKIEQARAEEQIEAALALLQEKTGTVLHFACPYGQVDAYTSHIVDHCYSLGHETFFTTTRGIHDDESSVVNGLYKRHHFEPFWPVSHTKFFLTSKRYQGA